MGHSQTPGFPKECLKARDFAYMTHNGNGCVLNAPDECKGIRTDYFVLLGKAPFWDGSFVPQGKLSAVGEVLKFSREMRKTMRGKCAHSCGPKLLKIGGEIRRKK